MTTVSLRDTRRQPYRERALREATQAGAIGVEAAHSIDSLT